MRAAVFHGPRDIRFEDVPRPDLNEGEALISHRIALEDASQANEAVKLVLTPGDAI
jgi:hypothetical protein